MAAQLEMPRAPLVPMRAGVVEYLTVLGGRPARKLDEPMSSGIDELDHILDGGFRRGQVTVLLASSSAGKSSLAEQIALDVAQHWRVKYDSLEMGIPRTTTRLLAKLMRLDETSVKNLLATRPDHPGVRSALRRLSSDLHLILDGRDDETPYTSDHLCHFAAETSPDFLVIDDLQCLDDWEGNGAGTADLVVRNRIVSKTIAMAKLLDCHIFIPHQTKAEKSGHPAGRRPVLDDCADTMKLVRRADNVLALHRPLRGEGVLDTVAELLVRKNRTNGREATLHLFRNAKAQRLESMTTDEVAALACCKPGRSKR